MLMALLLICGMLDKEVFGILPATWRMYDALTGEYMLTIENVLGLLMAIGVLVFPQ